MEVGLAALRISVRTQLVPIGGEGHMYTYSLPLSRVCPEGRPGEPVGTQGVRARMGPCLCPAWVCICKTRTVWNKCPPNDTLKDYPTLCQESQIRKEDSVSSVLCPLHSPIPGKNKDIDMFGEFGRLPLLLVNLKS